MAFWGFAMNFMLRMNLNIAIVSMVRHTVKNDGDELINELNVNRSSSSNSSFIVNTKVDNVSDIFFLINCK